MTLSSRVSLSSVFRLMLQASKKWENCRGACIVLVSLLVNTPSLHWKKQVNNRWRSWQPGPYSTPIGWWPAESTRSQQSHELLSGFCVLISFFLACRQFHLLSFCWPCYTGSWLASPWSRSHHMRMLLKPHQNVQLFFIMSHICGKYNSHATPFIHPPNSSFMSFWLTKATNDMTLLIAPSNI